MKILCVIGARGGSQGVPGKNIKILQGKPLISWTILEALKVPEIDRLIVSTDSQEIANIAKYEGAEVPFIRPDKISGPNVGKFEVWKHALAFCEDFYDEQYDIYLDLDCTNPLRSHQDISNVIIQLIDGMSNGVDAVFSVCEARKNPYFNLVEYDDEGALRMSKTLGPTIIRRQDAPDVYEHVASIYALRTKYVRTNNHLLNGHAEGYDIGFEKSFDVDSDFDFELIEFLMNRKKISHE